MKATKLYSQLEEDFIKPGLSDEWRGMEAYGEHLTKNFKERHMGLVVDNAKEINKVYTAVFPENEVMEKILKDGVENAMLFLHHPLIWDLGKAPEVFYAPKKEYLDKFKERNISIYALHVPLDNYSEYSTSVTLANALGVKIEKPFGRYYGALCGVIGTVDFRDVEKLKEKFAHVLGHEIRLYKYGGMIKDGKVAVVAGGGNELDILNEVKGDGANTLITGITYLGDYSKKVHDFEKINKINLLSGTHYSTEKFACQKMCKYFEKLGLKSEFVPGRIGLEDL